MRRNLHEVIFGTTTKSGRNFDLALLVLIVISVLLVMVESVPAWGKKNADLFFYTEWVFTIIFSIEYILRIVVAPKPLKYIFSTWGLIDLLSILPTFLTPFLSGYDSFRAIRALRLLRIFRILKLNRFTSESQALFHSLKASYYKIMVFFFFVLMMMILTGTIMYVIEDRQNGFDSIPASIYWAIVTTTTVGYGDITPATDLGKILASLMMITGYVIIAVPTGLITVEMSKFKRGEKDNLCPNCQNDNPFGSIYCNQCGDEILNG
ncbi:MAG: ion transporter [Crocinitomicaceae bacterium]|nr:ion transporter [Crocinitomicaceae bacterium]MDG1657904.1 ion transporter [Crocinitomicaceae bacterium]|tara:strand:- start:14014 stop:14808 length:795 start_codon:yes stop_codon:yes gene_type:complete